MTRLSTKIAAYHKVRSSFVYSKGNVMNPPMLSLTEATSSIDLRTELKIQSAFEKLMSGKTKLYHSSQTFYDKECRPYSRNEKRKSY